MKLDPRNTKKKAVISSAGGGHTSMGKKRISVFGQPAKPNSK